MPPLARRRFLSLLLPALLAGPARGEVPRPGDAEIEYLLAYIEKADVKFIRSGKEYPAAEGAAHLRSKLGKAGARVQTAEDFVAGIASKSYLTGDVYLVKTPDGKTAPTGPWLTKALAAHREAAKAR